MNRAERRKLLRETSGRWEPRPSPKELGRGTGWFGEMDRVFTDGKYVVMIRTIETTWGNVEHACMRNAASTDIPWREKQRIKNDIFGQERVAIEVFPAESELVDAANMYHIWVFEEGFKMPFSIKEKCPEVKQ